ncbi:MAG: hypothetical protein DRP82_02710 [Planctomycetota bacterium]|nr:MAG: hypothetical protein DRP82_02710 [Planctomycetota bacterium]
MSRRVAAQFVRWMRHFEPDLQKFALLLAQSVVKNTPPQTAKLAYVVGYYTREGRKKEKIEHAIFNLCTRATGKSVAYCLKCHLPFDTEDLFFCPNCGHSLCSYCAQKCCESVDAPDGQFVDAYCPNCGRQIADELQRHFALDWEIRESDLRERSAMEGK